MIRHLLEKILNWLKKKEDKKYAVDSSIYPKEHKNYIKTDRELLEGKEEENKYLRSEINRKTSCETQVYRSRPTKRTIIEETHHTYIDNRVYFDPAPSFIEEIVEAELIDDITGTELGTDMLITDTLFSGESIVSDIITTELIIDAIDNSWSGGYDTSSSWDGGYDSGSDSFGDSNW